MSITYCGICGSLDHDLSGHQATCDHAECLWPGECQDYTAPAPLTEGEHIAAAYAELGL